MELELDGRAALVGGASRGLGQAVAEALAAEGCRLAIWSRSKPALEEAAGRIRARYDVEVHIIEADASTPDAAGALAEEARRAVGDPDILVLNAGGPPSVDPTATSAPDWRRAMELLIVTPTMLATEFLPEMRSKGWGRVVAVLSSGIRQPIPSLVYSNAGRSALAAWLKTTALAVARDGVTLNGVIPGRFDTDRVRKLDDEAAGRLGETGEAVRAEQQASIPIGRYGRPEELASVVAFLCSERASYVTGSFVSVDGGYISSL